MVQTRLIRLSALEMSLTLLVLLSVACNAGATPTPMPTQSPSLAREPTSTPIPPVTPTPTPEPTSLGPLSTPTPTATDTPAPEPTRTPQPKDPTPTPAPSALITKIDVSNGKKYQKDVLTTGKPAYTDREYTFTNIPAVLEGQELIRTANDDKDVTADDFLTFTLTSDAIVYVLYDMRSITLPEWLADGSWEMTNNFVVTDDVIRRVYKKAFRAGEVTLGGNAQPPMTGPMSNYNVVARPADIAFSEPSLTSSGGVEFAVKHVVYNQGMLDQYIRGQLAGYVHPQDSFMLVSGNNSGNIDTQLLNSWAATLRKQYPEATLYAATSGMNNVRRGAIGLDLFAGLMMVYEPNQDNAPEFSWEMAQTRLIWEEAADIIGSSGLEPWGKPSGRSLPGGTYFGDWDYGVLAAVMSGVNVQTQGSCRKDELNRALQYLIEQYRGAQATSDLFVQVTVASDQTNYAAPEDAIYCAQTGWAYPEVDGVTMWWSPGSLDQAKRFLELREEQFLLEEGQTSAVDPIPTN